MEDVLRVLPAISDPSPLDQLREAMGSKVGPQMFRVRNSVTHAACEAVPERKRDRFLIDIWLGAVRGLVSPWVTKLNECLAEIHGNPSLLEKEVFCWIPARYAEHVLKLAEPEIPTA